MKRLGKFFVILIIILLTLSMSFFFVYMRPRHVTPILMYHGINNDMTSSLNVTPENFAKQMAFLHKAGYTVISLDDLVSATEKREKYPPKTVIITFDDGFEDNFINAFPVLAKYEMPATIFLITRYLDSEDGYLKWDQVNLMSHNKIAFGGHTRNNVYLPGVLGKDELWDEIGGSKEDIEINTGKEAGYFCYPIGGFTEDIKNIVKESGYKGACTTNRGFDKSNKDVYELNRVKITNSDITKPFNFRAKLSGYYNLFRSKKRGY